MRSSRRSRPAVEQLIERVRREHVPDFRSGIFDVHALDGGDTLVLRGQSTSEAAIAALIADLGAVGRTALDEVVRLPDPTLGARRNALVRAAIAPVYAEPRLPAPQISQLVLGMRVEILSLEREWSRVRAEDGYLGWVHVGYLQPGPEDQTFGWERGTAGESVVSLGAELHDDEHRPLARLPWGARIVRHTGAFHLPDGRRGTQLVGEVVNIDRLPDRFPARGESVARTARRWIGAPYLWGGVTLSGVDCSGFAQAVLWMHGIALPRDSDLQARTGAIVEFDDLTALKAGDLLYFAERDARVSHVAISLGSSLIIHSALANGGVAVDDIAGSYPFEVKLRSMLVGARRMLPD